MNYKTTAQVYQEKHGVPMPDVKGHATEAVKVCEQARQARIAASPTSREASDADVEHFEDSLKKVYYHARAGA